MTDEQIKYMVDRFLTWKLPEHFGPDNGISFDPIASKGTPYEFRREPVGTNLAPRAGRNESAYSMSGDRDGAPHDRRYAEKLTRKGARRGRTTDYAIRTRHGD